MSVAGSQQRTFLHLVGQLRPHWKLDRNLPARVQALLSRNRAFGSRDRRLYRELVYTTLRFLPWIEPSLDKDPDLAVRIVAWLAADSRATGQFRSACVGDWPPCPPRIEDKANILRTVTALTFGELLPDWFRAECPEAFAAAERDVLLSRAPLWLRVQTDNATHVTEEFSRLGWRYEFSAVLPSALRMVDEVDVTRSDAYQRGLLEIQDLGSQLILESVGVKPGAVWLDACAGAGGKTLQLARMLGSTGRVDAYDVRSAALRELQARAERAHLVNVAILKQPPHAMYDGVLVDAPCSGTGTWRRSPHLKWTTSPEDIREYASIQTTLLSELSSRVAPAGQLVYATCSLSHRENSEVVARFLQEHREFVIEAPARAFGAAAAYDGLTFYPSIHDTDGFFVATFRRSKHVGVPPSVSER